MSGSLAAIANLAIGLAIRILKAVKGTRRRRANRSSADDWRPRARAAGNLRHASINGQVIVSHPSDAKSTFECTATFGPFQPVQAADRLNGLFHAIDDEPG